MPEISIGIEKKVLDKGFVKLVDIMPRSYNDSELKCDESIVRAARVSYNQSSKGTDRDTKLINYLVGNRHMVPLESVVFQFQIKCPIFVQRHIVKHRMSSMNEISARYTKVIDEWYVPDRMRKQCNKNKQASSGTFEDDENEKLVSQYNSACDSSYQTYEIMLLQGISREMARTILPQSMYTEFFWKIDLRNALHFCNLRNSSDSQWETQEFAKAIEEIISETNPISYKAFRF
jgi:thymidylate synthase (FAD)